jgi:hypothetical protein
MMGLAMMRGTLSAIGALFGGLGVFFLYYSFTQPTMAVRAASDASFQHLSSAFYAPP